MIIDPKGLIGDPHYETSNIFRNPYGAGETARRPERIDRTADVLAALGNLDRRRLLAWAMALGDLRVLIVSLPIRTTGT